MADRRGRAWALVIIFIIMAGPLASIDGSYVRGDPAGHRGPGDSGSGGPWTDTLDDLSRVYVPPGGLVHVVVQGGAARIEGGYDDGWIASEEIICPPGYKYNIAYIEASIPGNSTVAVSILDATEEASEVGFANETVPNFKLVEQTDLSLTSISQVLYPRVRIQVTLRADGANRPTLDYWSLYFSNTDEWRDEFLGTGKMVKNYRLNFTDGSLEINHSGRGAGNLEELEYEAYPPLFAPSGGGSSSSGAFYANSGRTGYNPGVQWSFQGMSDGIFGDLNDDGKLDMVASASGYSGSPVDSYIHWGTGTERWPDTGSRTALKTERVIRTALGDFNGDDNPDIAFACNGGDSTGSAIFLNNGDGTYNHNPDVHLASVMYDDAATGDVNGDDYDDVLFARNTIDLYFGGPDGPDGTIDKTISADPYNDPLIFDVDMDGYGDIIICDYSNNRLSVYLGGLSGPDDIADIEYTITSPLGGVEIGDVNGDGLLDLVTGSEGSPQIIAIYEGLGTGWDDNHVHEISISGGHPSRIVVADVDRDGFDDILVTLNSNDLHLIYGGAQWPTTSTVITTNFGSNNMVVAVPPRVLTPGLSGGFETEPITLPDNDKRWDILDLQGTMPKNTSVTISILDSNKKPIEGYKDLTDWNIDLSGLKYDRTIRVRVQMRSEFNTTTPTIEVMRVKWQDKMTWREQFYGTAKVGAYLGLDISGGVLQKTGVTRTAPEVLFSSEACDAGSKSMGTCFLGTAEAGIFSMGPLPFNTPNTKAVAVADANRDGFDDVAFARYQTAGGNYSADSPLYLNSHVGWKDAPDHKFATTGATDVLLDDLNGDDLIDVVFAQETDGTTYRVDSALYWGSDTGWNATPDVEFATRGASGVVAVDVNKDGLLDLAFSCYKDTSTSTNSMVFFQDGGGFNGSSPDRTLATLGARAVAAGDLDKDGLVDLVFANGVSGGVAEINSYVYFGAAGGNFVRPALSIPTLGAEDVMVSDIDEDGNLDLVFANFWDNAQNQSVDSYLIYGSGTRSFPTSPSAYLPTLGASGVDAADLNNDGWVDLVFACREYGDPVTYQVPSAVYLGGAFGWSSGPDIELPTEGASDVVIHDLVRSAYGGYMSKAITPENIKDVGAYHTLSYSAGLGAAQQAKLKLLDADTFAVIEETDIVDGDHEWTVEGLFDIREHPSVRVVVTVDGLDRTGDFVLDDLVLNWTHRVKLPPEVLGISASKPDVYRLDEVDIWVNVTDEYDPVELLTVVVKYSPNEMNIWATRFITVPKYREGAFVSTFKPPVTATVGGYDFLVTVMDEDGNYSGEVVFTNVVNVLNNLPTAPTVTIEPDSPITSSTIQVHASGSRDVEASAITYHYRWYRNGELLEGAYSDYLDASRTTKGDNITVEVRAFDGEEEGPPASAWVVVVNSAPRPSNPLPDPYLDEDTTDDQWLNLASAFEDPDGDRLTYSVAQDISNVTITIDQDTGRVTLEPNADWFGTEVVTFVASDGVRQAQVTVTITVNPVNDAPWFDTVDGKPVTGDTYEYSIAQDEELVIVFTAIDLEGDELIMTINTSMVDFDDEAMTIRFLPTNDDVGTLRFSMMLKDSGVGTEKATLHFIVVVSNVNDPLEDPTINTPAPNERFLVNSTVFFSARCQDPDSIHGEVLNFSWNSNISGHLGYGQSLSYRMGDPGRHQITLTVKDGDFVKTVELEIVIEAEEPPPPPPPPPEEKSFFEEHFGLIAGIILVLMVVGAIIFITTTKRRTEQLEAADEAEYKRDHLERAAKAVKDAADHLESGREKAAPSAAGTSDEEAPEAASADEYEEIEIAGTVQLPSTTLTMESARTEETSAEVQQLWEGISEVEEAPAEETEALRLDNLKRKYQNAIGRLPYGIPSKELQDMDWVALAAALATGEKKTLPDGMEITEVDGNWYYSDPGDSSTFLKAHGETRRAEAAAPAPSTKIEPSVDELTLLAKLEERFILGEISEDAYNKLRKKYGG